jgi:hypothetical protein
MAEAMADGSSESDLALEWLAMLEDDPVLIGMAVEVEGPTAAVSAEGTSAPNDNVPLAPKPQQVVALPERRE